MFLKFLIENGTDSVLVNAGRIEYIYADDARKSTLLTMSCGEKLRITATLDEIIAEIKADSS